MVGMCYPPFGGPAALPTHLLRRGFESVGVREGLEGKPLSTSDLRRTGACGRGAGTAPESSLPARPGSWGRVSSHPSFLSPVSRTHGTMAT